MREPLMELRRRVYRRSISKGVGVIEAIDEILTEVSLSPSIASAAMTFSSVSVIANALRRRKLAL
jgi:cation transport ATPase